MGSTQTAMIRLLILFGVPLLCTLVAMLILSRLPPNETADAEDRERP